jgi:hypothetical protein
MHDSRYQTAGYHTLGTKLGASFLTRCLAALGVKVAQLSGKNNLCNKCCASQSAPFPEEDGDTGRTIRQKQ